MFNVRFSHFIRKSYFQNLLVLGISILVLSEFAGASNCNYTIQVASLSQVRSDIPLQDLRIRVGVPTNKHKFWAIDATTPTEIPHSGNPEELMGLDASDFMNNEPVAINVSQINEIEGQFPDAALGLRVLINPRFTLVKYVMGKFDQLMSNQSNKTSVLLSIVGAANRLDSRGNMTVFDPRYLAFDPSGLSYFALKSEFVELTLGIRKACGSAEIN